MATKPSARGHSVDDSIAVLNPPDELEPAESREYVAKPVSTDSPSAEYHNIRYPPGTTIIMACRCIRHRCTWAPTASQLIGSELGTFKLFP